MYVAYVALCFTAEEPYRIEPEAMKNISHSQ